LISTIEQSSSMKALYIERMNLVADATWLP